MTNSDGKKQRPGPDVPHAQVYVTLGGGVTLGVNMYDDLVIEDAFVRMSLGKFTHKRLEDMKSFLDQLKPHAI